LSPASPQAKPTTSPQVAFEQMLSQAFNLHQEIQQKTAETMLVLRVMALAKKDVNHA